MAAITPINEAFSTSEDMEGGLTILARKEWLSLQAFCDMALYTNPTTEKAMRVLLKVPEGTPLRDDFAATMALYQNLKGYCDLFDKEIKPGTIDLASDIVHYNTSVQSTYARLIKLYFEQLAERE